METEIEINGRQFRIGKMNMIELLAFNSQINFDSFESTLNLYKLVLEHIEFKSISEKWVPVKTSGREIYTPADIENDADSLQKLYKLFFGYVRSVFQKSNE